MAAGLFSAARRLFKGNQKADIDSANFKVHFQLTPKLMFGFLLVVILYNLVDGPIRCEGYSVGFSENTLSDYCWTQNSFTMRVDHRRLESGASHPGFRGDEAETVIYHAHSQWIPFVLFLQGLVFYIPHWLWKRCEGGRLRSLSVGLSAPFMDKELRLGKIQSLARYLHTSLHQHSTYAVCYFVCETLNLVVCFFNLWFMDMFLGGAFSTHGLSVMDLIRDTEGARQATSMVFPRMAKCLFYKFGSSGVIETHDLLCVLSHSSMHLKMFAFLWLYFVILSCLGAAMLIWCLLVTFSSSIRSYLLRKQGNLSFDTDALVTKLGIGDFFLVYLLSKNVEFHAFSILMEELSGRLTGEKVPRIYPGLDDKDTDITPV